MLNTIKRPLVAFAATCMLVLGGAAGPASADTQSGLVNVDISDNTVQVPVAVAANICGVQIAAIASNTFGGNAVCTSTSRSTASDHGGGGGGSSHQDGLVNVLLTGNTVQVPIGIAANICGVQAAVIAHNTFGGNAKCTATDRSTARS